MNSNYKARHTEIDDELIEYCDKRFAKFKRLLPESAFLEIEFIDEFGGRGGVDKRVQIDLAIPGEKQTFHLDHSSSDWHASVDILQEKLEKEVKRWREKNIDSHRRPRKYTIAEKEQFESGEL